MCEHAYRCGQTSRRLKPLGRAYLWVGELQVRPVFTPLLHHDVGQVPYLSLGFNDKRSSVIQLNMIPCKCHINV